MQPAASPDGDGRPPPPLTNRFPARGGRVHTCRCRVCPRGARRRLEAAAKLADLSVGLDRLVLVEAGKDGKLRTFQNGVVATVRVY
jgi:hypothetical protein